MKNIICFLLLFSVMIAVSLTQGCGGKAEDEQQKAVSEHDAVQTVIEKDKEQPAPEADETAVQDTVPSDTLEKQPVVQEVTKDISDEANNIVSQTPPPVEKADAGPIAQEIVEVINIENQGYASDKKGPVKFSHLKHSKEYGAACTQCHHVYKDGENTWKQGDKTEKCITCHDPVEEKDKVLKLQNAFHKNCKDCHTEVNKEGKKAPATKCNECHSQAASS